VNEVIALKVDPGSTERVRSWDGDEGAYRADNAEHFDRAVAGYHMPFMTPANISVHDRPTTPATASSTDPPPESSGQPAHILRPRPQGATNEPIRRHP
jgi:hypothetical protein